MRIWWQSFVDPAQNEPYLTCLGEYLNEIADPETIVDVHGMTPGDRSFGRLTELRCAALAVDNALDAAASGYDAFVMGHFQDSGLYEARSALTIPVVGLGETSLHWAAQIGRNIGVVTIDPVFERWHLEQADLYGLSGRVSHVVGLGLVVEDFAASFAGDTEALGRMVARFRALVRATRRRRCRRDRSRGRASVASPARRARPDRRTCPRRQLHCRHAQGQRGVGPGP